jgi:hypothetical protein
VIINEWQLTGFRPLGMNSRESLLGILHSAITSRIMVRTAGRIRSLVVELRGDAVVIHGCVDCFHLKQLALQGVRDVLGLECSVRIELDVLVESAAPVFVDPRPSPVP